MRRSTAYWLLVRCDAENGDGGADLVQALQIAFEGSEVALAVFSFEEEARMFAWCGAAEAGWHPRHTTPDELLQMLSRSPSTPRFVALDPMSEVIFAGLAPLLSLSRERFVDRLAEKIQADTAMVPGP
jgi:hypothetical protein